MCGLCCAVLQIYTPHRTVHRITFAGPSSRNLSTMTSTYVLIITSPRAHCSRGSTSSVRVQRVGCTTGICNSNEVACVSCSDAMRRRCDAAPMRCGADAMRRRCDAAMRRRCDGDATAQNPAQKPAQKPAQYMQVFLQKYSRIVTHTAVGMCRYFMQNTCK